MSTQHLQLATFVALSLVSLVLYGREIGSFVGGTYCLGRNLGTMSCGSQSCCTSDSISSEDASKLGQGVDVCSQDGLPISGKVVSHNCKLCGQGFGGRTSLWRHVGEAHPGVRMRHYGQRRKRPRVPVVGEVAGEGEGDGVDGDREGTSHPQEEEAGGVEVEGMREGIDDPENRQDMQVDEMPGEGQGVDGDRNGEGHQHEEGERDVEVEALEGWTVGGDSEQGPPEEEEEAPSRTTCAEEVW